MSFIGHCSELEFAGSSQHLFRVARDADFRPDPHNPAGAIDQKGLTDDAHEFAPVHRFLSPGAIGSQHLSGFVRSKGNGELMLRLELVLGCYGVGRNPEDCGSGLGKIAAQA